MDYTREFRKFISSQYLYAGVRITAGAIIPALILHHFGLLDRMMAIPLGALVVSFTDTPGPPQHRRNGMLVSILLNFIIVVIVGLTRHSPWFISAEIIIFGLLFSLVGVYGNRVNAIGLIALLVFIFNVDSHLASANIWRDALWFSVGGIWYAILSLTLYSLRPYKPIQQLLGENLMGIADYLRIKAAFYDRERNDEALYRDMMRIQVSVHLHQDELREMLFRARRVLFESTSKGRILMMMFLDSMDLFERIMTTQQDYDALHKEFDDSQILQVYHKMIMQASDELHRIGLAVQEGLPYKDDNSLDEAFKATSETFFAHRDAALNPHTIEGLIKLRHILYSIEDLVERIGILAHYSTYDRSISKNKKIDPDRLEEQDSPGQEFNIRLLVDNLSLQSSHFRHAIRVTLAMMIGYIISLLYPLGHGYWILLTIVTILKPAYSITRQRNIHRLAGTLIGAAISFGSLYLIKDNTAIFIIMLIAMILAYTYIKLNYLIGSAGITIYVVLSLHFMNPSGLTEALTDRIIDTGIGSLIAYLVSKFVLPLWEHEQIDTYIQQTIKASRSYFDVVASYFTGQVPANSNYRLARKEAFVALANMSDHFQRMLSEPKNKQPGLPHYHQFVATSHLLNSHIASLSYYAQRSAAQYASPDFAPLVKQVDDQFQNAEKVLEKQELVKLDQKASEYPIRARLQQLLEQRRQEMAPGADKSAQSVRKTLSDLKAITDQYQLIYSIVSEQVKIIGKMRKVE
ncbi:FUSC family protein [Paraflavitalea pollutisoli]|uniref:FUSC family protein n=1 Tax=Paraflavitalea pollutisoli TaxID=3034143 RepID=UPI0023EABB2E|nr:FUSC family membrane protein [Paraflavitalea sp. H1-2-19X]